MRHCLLTTLTLAAAIAVLASCGTGRSKKAQEKEIQGQVTEAAPPEEDLSQYMPTIAVGETVPYVEIPSSDGTMVSIADFAGHYTVLDFWASWCPDCRAEFDAVKALYGKYSPEGIRFLGISFDYEDEAWKNCLKEQGFEWPQVSNLIKKKENPLSDAFGVKWIPAMILMDPSGKVAATALTAKDMDEILSNIQI